jgi:citrate lyase beta subunit
VIWDLEDGVAASDKDVARAELVTLLDEVGEAPRPPWVRINSPLTPRGEEDLRLLLDRLPPGRRRIAVPKADRDTLARLAPWRAAASWLLLVETAAAFLSLLRGEPWLWRGEGVRLGFGALDYLADVGGSVGSEERELLLPRTVLVWASREQGYPPPVDTVYPAFQDDEGLRRSTLAARALGFAGRLVVHPRQIPVVHEAFRPNEAERAWAEAVVREAEGRGAVQVEGAMVDKPVLDRARAILAASRDDPAPSGDAV